MVSFKFGAVQLPQPQAVLARNICAENALTDSELYYKWEAWALANEKSTDLPSEKDLHALATYIRRKVAQESSKPIRSPVKSNRLLHAPGPTPISTTIDDFFTYFDHKPESPDNRQPDIKTDSEQHATPLLSPDAKVTVIRPTEHNQPYTSPAPLLSLPGDEKSDQTYADREGSGRVDAVFNSSEVTPHNHMPRNERGPIAVQTLTEFDPFNTRYMNDTPSDRINSVRNRLRTLGAQIMERIKQSRGSDLPPLSSLNFSNPSPNVILCIGRIRTDLSEIDGLSTGRINPNAVVLENEEGYRIKLDLSRLIENKLPLFLNPGMIVVVEGVNTNGRIFSVHSIFDNSLKIPSKEDDTRQGDDIEALDDDGIHRDSHTIDDSQPYANIIAASGPFTSSSNLKFAPLEDLLQIVLRNKPDVVVLMGPFLQEAHELISEDTPLAFDDVFTDRILSPIQATLRGLRDENDKIAHFIIMPSLEDAHHDFVCPQPPFRWTEEISEPNIQFCPNPCMLKISAMDGGFCSFIGASSLPALLDISADSVCINKEDRLGAIVSHLLRQKSFYPTFPPSASVPLDTQFLHRLDITEVDTGNTIDLMIVPSKLKAFAKSVEGNAMAVNPGLVCRGSSGGTYAEVALPLHTSGRRKPLRANEDKIEINVIRL